MPVKAPRVFEAQVSPADFIFHNRRGFLLGLGALLVPKRSIFLPPLGGWPEPLGGFYYDGSLAGKLKMVITPLLSFRQFQRCDAFYCRCVTTATARGRTSARPGSRDGG